MSLISVFTKVAPTINGHSFDAVLEDSLEIGVELTSYPIESGARIVDHRILLPFKWTMTGAISNNQLKTNITDFAGGLLSNLTDNPYVAAVAGMSAAFLAGSTETRASSTLAFLIDLMRQGDPIDIDAGDIFLKNMIITKLSRTKEPRNEGGLEFVVEMQELITLDRLVAPGQPIQAWLRTGDPTKSSLARAIERGQQMAKDTSNAVASKVDAVLDGIF